MSVIQKIEDWGDRHHPKWIDILRILLGLVIFLKGVQFVANTDALMKIMDHSKFPWVSFSLAHYVAFAHLVGGLLIMLGLITRVAIVFQLPVLIGAVIFINAQKGFFSVNSELSFSLIVLFLLLFFLVEGSGPLSVDEFMRRHHNV
jgi:putative oxidoreductase